MPTVRATETGLIIKDVKPFKDGPLKGHPDFTIDLDAGTGRVNTTAGDSSTEVTFLFDANAVKSLSPAGNQMEDGKFIDRAMPPITFMTGTNNSVTLAVINQRRAIDVDPRGPLQEEPEGKKKKGQKAEIIPKVDSRGNQRPLPEPVRIYLPDANGRKIDLTLDAYFEARDKAISGPQQAPAPVVTATPAQSSAVAQSATPQQADHYYVGIKYVELKEKSTGKTVSIVPTTELSSIDSQQKGYPLKQPLVANKPIVLDARIHVDSNTVFARDNKTGLIKPEGEFWDRFTKQNPKFLPELSAKSTLQVSADGPGNIMLAGGYAQVTGVGTFKIQAQDEQIDALTGKPLGLQVNTNGQASYTRSPSLGGMPDTHITFDANKVAVLVVSPQGKPLYSRLPNGVENHFNAQQPLPATPTAPALVSGFEDSHIITKGSSFGFKVINGTLKLWDFSNNEVAGNKNNESMILQTNDTVITIGKGGMAYAFPPGSKLDMTLRDSGGAPTKDEAVLKKFASTVEAIGQNAQGATIDHADRSPNKMLGISTPPAAPATATPAAPVPATPTMPTNPANKPQMAVRAALDKIALVPGIEAFITGHFGSKDKTESFGHNMRELRTLAAKEASWTAADVQQANRHMEHIKYRFGIIKGRSETAEKEWSSQINAISEGQLIRGLQSAIDSAAQAINKGASVDEPKTGKDVAQSRIEQMALAAISIPKGGISAGNDAVAPYINNEASNVAIAAKQGSKDKTASI